MQASVRHINIGVTEVTVTTETMRTSPPNGITLDAPDSDAALAACEHALDGVIMIETAA